MSEDRQAIIERVRELVEPVIADADLELVDIEYVGGRGRYILRLLIDKPARVTLDECVAINRQVSDLLDIEDPIPHSYTLEVSSPGWDRPFKTRRDYERACGDWVKIITSEAFDGTTVHTGRLERCDEGVVTLFVDETPRRIPLEKIQKAHRKVVWE